MRLIEIGVLFLAYAVCLHPFLADRFSLDLLNVDRIEILHNA